MTVAELIALLKDAPQDTEVLVDGYECGAQPPRYVGMWRFWKDKGSDHTYGGPHEPESSHRGDDPEPDMAAFFISRSTWDDSDRWVPWED